MSESATSPLPRPTSLRETALCHWHAAHGGRMVDFAGWNMPVQYASIVDEHLATRSSVGLFVRRSDRSVVGEIVLSARREYTP